MRRLLLAFEPPDGGVAENVAQLALGLPEHGWEPVVAGPREAGIYGRLEEAGVELHRLPLTRDLGGPWGALKALRALRGKIMEGRFQLVHSHSSKAGALSRPATPRQLPSVYTPHCFAFVGDVSRTQRTLSLTVERLLGWHTDAIICVCDWERRIAEERRIAAPHRLRSVHNGVEACADPTPDPTLMALRGDGVLLGAIAVMRRQKRLDLLIDAAPSILAANPRARVAIIGNGPERERLLAHAAGLGLDRDPRFMILPFEDTSWPYLAALDVFVLPSAWEALPIGVLEALACGVPQVATEVGGAGEAVTDGETGLLVEPRAEELAAAATTLCGDPVLREAMAAASRRRHEARFTVKQMVADTAAVYESVLAAPG